MGTRDYISWQRILIPALWLACCLLFCFVYHGGASPWYRFLTVTMEITQNLAKEIARKVKAAYIETRR
jgi:hypothetical protein